MVRFSRVAVVPDATVKSEKFAEVALHSTVRPSAGPTMPTDSPEVVFLKFREPDSSIVWAVAKTVGSKLMV